MTAKGLGLKTRLRYLGERVRGFDAAALVSRSRQVATEHRRPMPVVLADMLFSAAFRDTAFQDYVDFDFAMLTRQERATFMTHSLSNHIAMKFDHPDFRSLFHDKLEFNHTFDGFLGREWLDVRTASESAAGTIERIAGGRGSVVFLRDTANGDCTIPCDPAVVNKQPT